MFSQIAPKVVQPSSLVTFTNFVFLGDRPQLNSWCLWPTAVRVPFKIIYNVGFLVSRRSLMNISKYPSATLRPVRSTALYWIPSPAEHGLPSWHLQAQDESSQIIKKPRSSRRIPRLPAEIITEIVSHVWHEKTLKACAL